MSLLSDLPHGPLDYLLGARHFANFPPLTKSFCPELEASDNDQAGPGSVLIRSSTCTRPGVSSNERFVCISKPKGDLWNVKG